MINLGVAGASDRQFNDDWMEFQSNNCDGLRRIYCFQQGDAALPAAEQVLRCAVTLQSFTVE